MRMDSYQDTRQRLETRMTQLSQRLHKIEGDRRRERNPLDLDWQEQAITRQNDEVLDHLDAESHREIEAIQAALKRIDNGTYGICITCGQLIAPARLEALPYAVTCMICASRAESDRH